MRKTLIIILFLMTALFSRAQLCVSIYPLNNSFGFRTSMEHITSLEARFTYDFVHHKAANVFQFHPEFIWCSRVASTEQVDYRTGFGFGYNFDNVNGDAFTLCLPFSIVYYPIRDNKHLCFNFEVGPIASFSGPDQRFSARGVAGATFFFYNNVGKKNQEVRDK